MSIFRAYDIRGIYKEGLDEALAEKIGKAFGTFIFDKDGKEKIKIAVGGDVRTSTPSLKSSLIDGLLSTGATVIDIGMVPTPMLYFAVASLGLDGGAIVTASHNSKEYNGFKLVGRGGVCLSWETGIKKAKEIIDSSSFRIGQGTLEKSDVEEEFINHVTSKVKINKKLKVVVDAANAAACVIGPKVFERVGCEVVRLFCEPDGNFPNHEADPIRKKNLVALQEAVRREGADLGVAYDGDGDRLGVVNEKGEVTENNAIFSLFIKDTLQLKPDSKVIYEVIVSKMIEDTILRYGGKPLLSRVGHSYIQSLLNKENAALAGENSGHYYFLENYGYDDAIFASLKTAELLNKGILSEREKEIPRYITSEEFRPFCADNRKFQVIQSLQEKLRSEGHNLVDIDGARVTLDNGWFVIRASNTGTQLVVRWEADNQESFNKIESLVKENLGAFDVKLEQ